MAPTARRVDVRKSTRADLPHIRALTTRAYDYHSPEALIAMAMLTRGGLQLELPGRK